MSVLTISRVLSMQPFLDSDDEESNKQTSRTSHNKRANLVVSHGYWIDDSAWIAAGNRVSFLRRGPGLLWSWGSRTAEVLGVRRGVSL